MAESFGARLRTLIDDRGALCVGVDPSAAVIEQWGRHDDPEGVEFVALSTVEAAIGTAVAIKPQVAFFERFGSAGYRILERVIREAGDASLLVVADAKRGDIGSSVEGYAQAWLSDRSPLAVDALTANPFLGVGALRPLVDAALATGRGLFILAATSNPEGRTIQSAIVDGERSVEVAVLEAIGELNASADGFGSVGAVIGATREPLAFDLARLGGPILVPGVGAQGATVERVSRLFGEVPRSSVLVNVGRAILERGPDRRAVYDAARRWRDEISSALP